jgi:hypothetical protein
MGSSGFGRVANAVLSIVFISTLAGCGGGGGGGGGGGSTPPPVTTSRLTITGTVTDGPIASAVVTATVSGQTFTATADANGSYRVELSVPETATSGFVTLTAKGAGSQVYVEFTSLLGTFQALKTQAGSDEVLSSSENFATQITNVSTAMAVLLQQANSGQPVASQAQLDSLSVELNSQNVLDLATAIKLLVDRSGDYPMPAGYTSLRTLLANTTAREQLVIDTLDRDRSIFASTQAAIASDATLIRPVTSATLPRTLTAARLPEDIESTYSLSNRVVSYTFNPDGTGTASMGAWNVNMTWTLAGSNVQISYAQTVRATDYELLICPTGGVGYNRRNYYIQYEVNGATLSLLNERVLTVTESRNVIARGCWSPPGVETATTAFTVLKDEDFGQIAVTDLRASARSMGVYDTDSRFKTDIADWNADGTGSTRILGKHFTWALDSTGRVATVTFDDSTVARYRMVRALDDVAIDVVQEFVLPTGRRIEAAPSVRIDPTRPFAFTQQTVPGRYYSYGIGDYLLPPEQKGPRWRYDANGLGAWEEEVRDENGNYTVWDDDRNGHLRSFRWSIDAEDLVALFTYDTNGGPYNCVPNGTTCQIVAEYRQVPMMRIGSRLYWLIVNRSYPATYPGAPIYSSQVAFADYEPFGG